MGASLQTPNHSSLAHTRTQTLAYNALARPKAVASSKRALLSCLVRVVRRLRSPFLRLRSSHPAPHLTPHPPPPTHTRQATKSPSPLTTNYCHGCCPHPRLACVNVGGACRVRTSSIPPPQHTHIVPPTRPFRELPSVRMLIEEKGVLPNDINPNDPDRRQAIHFAVAEGRLGVVRYLVLECGAAAAAIPQAGRVSVNARWANGRTPLMLALEQGHEAVALFLIGEGQAAVEAKDQDGRTALMYAGRKGMLGAVRALVLDRGADVRAKERTGNDVAAIVAGEGHVEVMAFLVQDAHVDIEATDHTAPGLRLPYLAAMMGHLELVRWMVEHGHADVRGLSTHHQTMAHHAAANYNHLATLKYLVEECNAPLEATTATDRMTALHFAAMMGNYDMVKWLVQEKGANLFATEEHGWFPKVLARREGHMRVLALLEEWEQKLLTTALSFVAA